MLTIDGSFGEGGGQILRTSLSLSLITGKAFTIENIRANRKPPGLRKQHAMCVRAAAQIGSARLEGAKQGSERLVFEPQTILPGQYHFLLGSAGSTTLILQTVLPPLLCASGPSIVILEGGTHNPFAPPFDFLDKAFLAILRRMGAKINATLEKPGFYPAGGGRMRIEIEPVDQLRRMDLSTRGEIESVKARAVISKLPRTIAERELAVCRRKLQLKPRQLIVEEYESKGPGNVVFVEVESEALTEVFVGFGKKGVRAENVAKGVCKEVKEYLQSSAPVGEHLADQLLIPLAMAKGGSFRTVTMSQHLETNMDTIKKFLDIDFVIEDRRTEPYIIVDA